MTKEKLKSKIKKKSRKTGISQLKHLQQNHSKVKQIQQLELMQYLKSPIFTTENMKLLLALRTRTVKGIRADFSGMFTSTLCPLCGEHLDSTVRAKSRLCDTITET